MPPRRDAQPASSTVLFLSHLMRIAGGLLAILGAAALVAYERGALDLPTAEPGTADPSASSPQASPTAPHVPPDQPGPAPPTTPSGTPRRVAPAPLRLGVCGREEAPAQLYELTVLSAGASLWAIACGASTHVVAFDSEQGQLFARRVAEFLLPSPALDRAPRPAPITWMPSGSEGRGELVVSALRADRNGTPVSGALFVLPLDPHAGLGQPRRVQDAIPGALATGRLFGDAQAGLALLQLGDARLPQPAELWWLSAQPMLSRKKREALSPAANALAVIDLDGDGHDEVAVLAASAQRLSVRSNRAGRAALEIAIEGAYDVHAIALDPDGKRDLVVSGQQAQRVVLDPARVEPSPASEAQPGPDSAAKDQAQAGALALYACPALDGLRNLHAVDLDADGRLDIVGYAHPRLVGVLGAKNACEQQARRELLALHGDGFAVLEARLTHLDGDGRVDLLALLATEGPDPQIELLVLHGIEIASQTRQAATAPSVFAPNAAAPLRDATLLRSIELR